MDKETDVAVTTGDAETPDTTGFKVEPQKTVSIPYDDLVKQVADLRKEAAGRRVEARTNASERDKALEDAASLQSRLEAAETAARDAQLRFERAQVAAAHGLSAEQAARLTGTTPEELAADAAQLVQAFGLGRPQGSPTDGTPRVRTGGVTPPSGGEFDYGTAPFDELAQRASQGRRVWGR